MANSLFIPQPDKIKVIRRFHVILTVFNKMSPRWQGVHMDTYLLRHCVECYYDDVNRMKEFHGIHFADEHKRAAYTMKWICRIRPVMFEQSTMRLKATLLANESLAVKCATSFLGIEKPIDTKFLLHLLYSLHFRSPDEDWMRAVAYLMQKIYK